MNDKIIGLIGGMGPEASAYYYHQLVKRTKVQKDQDHFHVIMDANPKIPDRTSGILGKGESALPCLLESVQRLNLMEVDKAFITCITSHYYYHDLAKAAEFELLHPLKLLRETLHAKGFHKVGLLATSGTLKTELFQTYLEGIECLVPDQITQDTRVMPAIYDPDYGIKANVEPDKAIEEFKAVAAQLIEQGAEAIIGGCTEISMVLKQDDITVPLFDPMLCTIDAILGGQV